MRNTLILGALASVFLAGCAATPSKELSDCLQPNRRVVVEVGGRVLKPKPKPKPGEEAKPAPAKKAKPQYANVQYTAFAQGNSAWDVGSAVLKEGGKKDLDQLVANLNKRKVMIGSIIITGHTDRFE